MPQPFSVMFSGVPGVSKTPIAHYLSCEFGLPIINTDQIRYEVREDLRLDDINKPGGVEEYQKRATERFEKLLSSGQNFIFDDSMDRRWAEVKHQLKNAGYTYFLINVELSREFQIELFTQTGRQEWAETHIDEYIQQHEDFMAKHKSDILVQINDADFNNRLSRAATALHSFINGTSSTITRIKTE